MGANWVKLSLNVYKFVDFYQIIRSSLIHPPTQYKDGEVCVRVPVDR